MGCSTEILLLLMLPCGGMIKFNNGGFEDIVIAINPEICEDNKILESITDMVKEASSYLFNATEKRFYFKSVKVIIPFEWTSKNEYQRATAKSYEKSDIQIDDPYLKYGDEPYTLQYGGCGSPGRYIHFTPNFLTNDSLHAVYGSRGRVLVHEWAHLRWGVFDEYNKEAPFYAEGQNEVEATRCSADITGQYIFPIHPGKYRKCKFQYSTKIYEPGCEFVPDKVQKSPVSIMNMQSLSSVTQFCDQNSHNTKATNMQNKLCEYRSTWEVITSSTDFKSSSPISNPPPAPTISFLQVKETVVCLVLDVSSSMNSNNRINRLRQAAEIFLLQIIDTGSWVGIVTFQSQASVNTALTQIVHESVRQALRNNLPITAGGGTSICAGLRQGFQVIRLKYPSTEGSEIVLLTDGEDTMIWSCFNEVESSGSVIHTIALGPDAEAELEMLSTITGGSKFSATDNLYSNGLIDAFARIPSGNGNPSQQPIQLESKICHVDAYTYLNGTVTVDSTVGNDTYFVITWNESFATPGISLKDPKGKEYNHNNFEVDNTDLRTARLKINGTAEEGDWIYRLYNSYPRSQVLSITVTTRPASLTVPPVILKPFLNRDANAFPNPMILYAEVSQGFLPVIGANVIATVESASGTEELELQDKGSGADIIKHDGIYSAYFFSFQGNGRYSITVRVQGKGKNVRRARRQSQALYLPGYVENGEIKMNAPRLMPSDNDTQANIGSFSRIASGGSFVMTGVPTGGLTDVFPPCKVIDLEVGLSDGDEFLLSWTAPGNDYDRGKTERYEIKMSGSPVELRDATFHKAHSVDTFGLKPDAAGLKQFFRYKPVNVPEENNTAIYFALRAIDGNNNTGEVSNIARAVVPFSPSRTTPSNSSTSLVTLSAVIVSAALIIICGCLTVYVLHKQKTRSYEIEMS